MDVVKFQHESLWWCRRWQKLQCVLSVSCLFLVGALFPQAVWAQVTLENPQPGSFQSGIGVISGWACDASQIDIEFDNDSANRWRAGTGTLRTDTQGVCGDTDNGFGLLFNWNLLDDGTHTVRAFADGVEFANVVVIVTTLGEEFLRDTSGEFPVADFPAPGDALTLRWQEAQQNFVITDGSPVSGNGGTSGGGEQILENPQPGSAQSGIGVISGCVCDANQIEIEFNNDSANRWRAGYGTTRADTKALCGDTNNGFGLLFNWNLLGAGTHTVTAYADGVEFARVAVTVTTLGAEFQRGVSRIVTLPDFPDVGTDVTLLWQEAQQNFVIAAERPTTRLVHVHPQIRLPSGIQVPNLMVSSLLSEQAEVQATGAPTLLLAENASGTVLLALANKDGGLLGEVSGEVEVSAASTAVTLIGLSAGIAVGDMTTNIVARIQADSMYSALQGAIVDALREDTNFLETGAGTTAEAVFDQVRELAARLRRDLEADGILYVGREGPRSGSPIAAGLTALLRAAGQALLPCEAHAQSAPARDCTALRERLRAVQRFDIVEQVLPAVGPAKDLIEAGTAVKDTYTGTKQECLDRARERNKGVWADTNDIVGQLVNTPSRGARQHCTGLAIGEGAAEGIEQFLSLAKEYLQEVIIGKGIEKLAEIAGRGGAWLKKGVEEGYATYQKSQTRGELEAQAHDLGCNELTEDDLDLDRISGGEGECVMYNRVVHGDQDGCDVELKDWPTCISPQVWIDQYGEERRCTFGSQ